MDGTARQRWSTGTPWEPLVGYSRAVRAGPMVHVSGTTATDADGRIVAPGDAYRQTLRALQNVRGALEGVGARVEDVVRTRLFVTDVANWKDVGRAHAEVFGHVRPATTLVQVAALVDPQMLVEIEAEAWVDRTPDPSH